MSQKSIRFLVYALKGGLFILPVLSLIVADFLFFPFITGKNFFFRIMVEVLFFLWIFGAVFDKNLRPRKSPVLLAFSATLFILFLATIFGENPFRSFWSNYERMEGFVGYLHLFAYFLILTSVLRKKRDFKILFGAMLAVSAIVTFYGFLQYFGKLAIHQGNVRLDATFGNAGYLAIFLVFHLFLTALFFYWFKNKWLRIGLVLLFALELVVLFFTATRGAILGFVAGLFLFAVLMAIFSVEKKTRLLFASLLFLVILSVGLFVALKDQSFIKKNPVLGRFSSISFSETTTESRLTIWGMSWQGFQEHPVLGWGQENYNLVFNKYFEPKLYKQEPWFDRAHNVFFDWLISAGALGFLAYMSIFVSVLFMLWRGYKKRVFSLFESAGTTSVLAAYGFHNLFVFDNLTSSFVFFTILGFVHSGWIRKDGEKEEKKEEIMSNKEISGLSYLVVTVCFLVIVFSLYFVNVKPLLAAKNLLNALSLVRGGAPIEDVLKQYDKVFSYSTFGTVEAREQLAGFANAVASNTNIPEKDRGLALKKAIEEMEKQIEKTPNDARYRIFLGSVYTRASLFDKAEATFEEAISLSPRKQQIYFALADVYFAGKNYQKAVEVLETAYNFDKSSLEAGKNLFMAAILSQNEQYVESLKIEIENRFGPEALIDKKFINVYSAVGDYEAVKNLWFVFIEKEPDNAQYRVSLGAAYLNLNEREKAIEQIQKAIEIQPSFKEQGEYFISEIRAGRNP